MKALPWFRMYTDFLNDPKMIALAFEDQRHFIGVLALKSEGVIDQDCDVKLLDRIVAQRLWLDYSTIGDVKKRLVDAGLISPDWQPLAWSKRQAKSDHDLSGAERQKRFRERNALRNGAVTPPEEIREEEKREAPARRSTRCPASFVVTDEMRQWASKEAPGVDLDFQTAVMKDHTFEKPKSDWPATWRNWIRRAHANPLGAKQVAATNPPWKGGK